MSKYYVEETDHPGVHHIKLVDFPGVAVASLTGFKGSAVDIKNIISMIENQPHNQPVEPTAKTCNCISGRPQTTGGCPIHGVKY